MSVTIEGKNLKVKVDGTEYNVKTEKGKVNFKGVQNYCRPDGTMPHDVKISKGKTSQEKKMLRDKKKLLKQKRREVVAKGKINAHNSKNCSLRKDIMKKESDTKKKFRKFSDLARHACRSNGRVSSRSMSIHQIIERLKGGEITIEESICLMEKIGH